MHESESPDSLPVPVPHRLAQTAGNYREWLPAQPLIDHVARVWTNDIPGPTRLEIVPDGCMDIIWTGDALEVAGPDTRVVVENVACPATLVGVRFAPGVAVNWLRAAASTLVNQRPPLAEFWGAAPCRRLSDQVAQATSPTEAAARLERALLDRLPRVANPDPLIVGTLQMTSRARSDGPALVRRLVARLGCSERTLRRRCLASFGYGPRTLARVLRFQRFVELTRRAPDARLSILAAEAGYADQAHLTREVRSLSGHTPRSLVRELDA